jgi:hypothetical protein
MEVTVIEWEGEGVRMGKRKTAGLMVRRGTESLLLLNKGRDAEG